MKLVILNNVSNSSLMDKNVIGKNIRDVWIIRNIDMIDKFIFSNFFLNLFSLRFIQIHL